MTPKLKPCPWCPDGGKLSVQTYPGMRHVKAVYCDRCGAWGPGGIGEEAVDAWNKRAGEKG